MHSHIPSASNTRGDIQPNEIPSKADPDMIPSERNETNPPSDTMGKTLGGLEEAIENIQISRIKDKMEPEASVEAVDFGQSKSNAIYDDDQTHLSNSSTKPISFDTKSMASVTTFAMDEKESLRPDDSASVQAEEEDDCLTSPPYAVPNILPGSESNPAQHYAPAPANTSLSIPEIPTAASLQFSERDGLRDEIPPGSFVNDPSKEGGLHSFPSEPDEKLLEALDSPKDRLLLLQLEDKIISFIQNSSDGSLELPPCNSFGRLLAHKLGDYYHLTHFVDNNVTSVRLHRTPWSRIPTPLTMLQGVSANTPPPAAPTMKIMRRVGHPGEKNSLGGSSAPSSALASNTASEAGPDNLNEDERTGDSSSAGGTPARDRTTLTREEREAKYQEVRERIFKDFPENKSSDSPNSGEQSSNVSRSNSRMGRKKGNRQRPPKDDGFEARSQFNAYYTSPLYMHGQIPPGASMHDPSINPHSHHLLAQQSGAGFHFTSGGQVPSIRSNNTGGMLPYGHVPPQPNQTNWQAGTPSQSSGPTPYHPTPQLSPMLSHQSSARSSPPVNMYPVPNPSQYGQPPMGWQQPPYPPNFPTPSRNLPAAHWPGMPSTHMPANNQMSYSNGVGTHQKLPNTSNPVPHLLSPASFDHPSFVPQGQPLAPPANSHLGYGDVGTQQQSAPRYPSNQLPGAPWQGFRDGSSHTASTPTNSHWTSKNNGNVRPPAAISPDQSQDFGKRTVQHDLIAKWGTPSHLPPKPPPSEVPYNFETNRTPVLPFQNSPGSSAPQNTARGPLVVSGATGQPDLST